MAITPSNTNDAIKFLAELVNRLFAKSPKFFRIIKVIAAILAIVTGLPGILESLGIHLPDTLAVLQNKVVSIAGLAAFFVSSLTVDRTTTSPTPVVGPSTLPLTEKDEAKKAADDNTGK